MSNIVKPTKDRGNFKKRKTIYQNSTIINKIKTQKTISTHLVLNLVDSLERYNMCMDKKYQKLANKTNTEIQLLRKRIRELEAELEGVNNENGS